MEELSPRDSDTEMIVRALLLMPGINQRETHMTNTTSSNGCDQAPGVLCCSDAKVSYNYLKKPCGELCFLWFLSFLEKLIFSIVFQSASGGLSRSLSDDGEEPDWERRIVQLMAQYPLAYSFLLLHKDAILRRAGLFRESALGPGKNSRNW